MEDGQIVWDQFNKEDTRGIAFSSLDHSTIENCLVELRGQ